MIVWEAGMLRLFASHRAEERAALGAVQSQLREYGISCFVAHQAIEVTLPWRAEIQRALETCQAMLVFAHPGFHESQWTDQEVGWALGRGVPIIVLMYRGAALGGFLEQYQAIQVDVDDFMGTDPPGAIAAKVVAACIDQPTLRTAVVDGLIEALGSAPYFLAAGRAAEMLETLGDELRRSDIVAILHHFRSNSQVGGAFVANQPLRRLVQRRAPDLVSEFWPPGDGDTF
jgi:hypothetical protein